MRAENDSYLDTGTLAASAGVDLKRIDEAVKVILAEFAQIAARKVGEKELKKAKEYIKGKMILSWEDSRTVAVSYGLDELEEGRVRTNAEILKQIDRVTPADILRLSRFLFTNSKLNLAVIGPFKEPERFRKLLKL